MTAQLRRTDDFGGLEMLSASLSAFEFRPHAHEEFFLAVTDRGLVTPTYRGRSHAIGPGELIVLNPEEPHAGGPPPGVRWTYRALYLRPELVRAVVSGVPRFAGDVVRDPQVAAGLRRYHRLGHQPGSDPLAREEQLAATLARLVRYAAAPVAERVGREPAAVRRSRDHLEAYAHERVTLAELARCAGLSPYHLCRVFHAAVGMTPHAYQTQVRVRRAKAMLRAGQPIPQVAAEAGFYDQAHLNRHFKLIVGVTPGQFRRGCAGPRRG